MSRLTKIILAVIAVLIVALIVGGVAFSALKHDSDNSGIRPLAPIEATTP